MDSIVLVLCWLGVFQSLLLSAYFLSAGRNSANQLLLGFTMVMIALRAAKSTLFLFHPAVPHWFLNVGFAAHAAIGPLLLLFAMSFGADFKLRARQILHFLPAISIALLSSLLELDSFWYRGGYSTLLAYTLAYTVWYIVVFIQVIKNTELTVPAKRWTIILLATLTLFQFSYFSNYMLRLTNYSSGPILYSVLIYVITFIVIKNNQVFKTEQKKKYQNINLTPEELNSHFKKMTDIMEQQKPYRDPEFSVQKLAELTKLQGYLISTVLSTKARLNFNQYINGFRIREAKLMLSNPKYDNLTIAAIAYECGFNSLSSFNTAFKKQVGVTPSAFKADRAAGPKEKVTDSLKSVPNS